ncbi:16S rRNA (cytosine(1402)-N(4))-methyltransferase RsmH [Candidatus Gottesmanbacteria bacterium]|nr:16S rRNA (cytosine(1402)-N(4))-methyltransferase RsmH [Candidatus Gottesmanbacteria bacterium]
MNGYHIPVLLNEVLQALEVEPGEKYIDCTYGGGGHFRAIQGAGGVVLGIDQDPEAQAPVHGNFAHLKEIALRAEFNQVAGILFDLGVSSHQLETDYRGFSFRRGGLSKLDMRMNQTVGLTAADLINAGSEKELANLFFKYGEERESRKIAKAIVLNRPVQTTDDLAKVILRVSHRSSNDRTHPATRVFQALRIAVNDELASLEEALPQALELLKPGGKLAVISFHSLEDRIVKNFMKKSLLIRPSLEEININPRARSGKLRVTKKI